MEIHRNNKTGNLYLVFGYALNCDNGSESFTRVLYMNPEQPGLVFDRDLTEFCQKFTRVREIELGDLGGYLANLRKEWIKSGRWNQEGITEPRRVSDPND